MKDLLKEDNKLLKKQSEEVDIPLSDEDIETLQQMGMFIMKSQTTELDENGEKYNSAVGLAAPQIGINKRMFVIGMPDDDNDFIIMAFVNPIVINESKTFISLNDGESCLSVQSMGKEKVTRFEWIRHTSYMVDLQTKEVSKKINSKLSGYLGIVFQHELDHLNGILYSDRVKFEKEIK